MSQTRFRQIARLEKLAERYLGAGRQTEEEEWQSTIRGAAANAAILAFLIRYGNPNIGEPLSYAWERFTDTHVWTEYCDKWETMALNQLGDDEWKEYGDQTPPVMRFAYISQDYRGSPYDRAGAWLRGQYLRHELMARFSGATEKEKLKRVFASAPPWLIWFTFADYTAAVLGLSLPDLSSVAGFARSKTDFDNWYGLPKGAFERRPWPDGPDHEPLARTDLKLLRPATQWPASEMTPREQKRAQATYMKSHPTERVDNWPCLLAPEFLTMPISKRAKLFSKYVKSLPGRGAALC
jgi:hypothetical protein